VDGENANPHEELQWLDERIAAATELAALKPIYFRLNEIIQAFPGDFEIQFTANDIKQRLMMRGVALKQRETFLSPRPAPLVAEPPPPPVSPLDTAAPAGPPATLPLFAPSPAQPPATAFGMTPEVPPPPPTLPPAPPRPPLSWSRAAVIGTIAGLLVAVVVGFWQVRQIWKRHVDQAAQAAVEVNIATTPPGASVTAAAGAGSQASCTSNCKLELKPGTYQIAASMAGFEPAAAVLTVTARHPATVGLTLEPQAQSVRLLTDLDQGKVVMDDRPPVNLEEGQSILDKLAPGAHTVAVTGQKGEASFSFEIADARMPVVAGPVKARNVFAVLVASFGSQARVVTNAGPWKLAVNGQPQPDAGPAGTDIAGFHPGVNEIVVAEGRDRHNMIENFGAAPMLTVFLKTNVDAGTLIVSTGQDDVRVFLDGKEYRQRTQRGQLRIETLGKVAVRVAKSGFEDAPAQTVEVKNGAEVRLRFDMKPLPQSGWLEIHGAIAGTEVFIDQRNAGAAGPDGSITLSDIRPGDHAIELRREQYLPKRLQRSFRAGQAVVLTGADVVLAAASGTVRVARNPASATVTYRRGDETETHEVRGNQIDLPPGNYAFSARAPGFAESTTRVPLAAGENRQVEFTLAARPALPPPAPVKGMAEFEDQQSWKKEGDNWVHEGGGFVPYKLPPKGVFTFTVALRKGGGAFRAGQIRWCLQYLDPKDYLLYEMDRKNFWAGVVEKGKRLERVKAPHNLGSQKTFTIQIEVAPDRLVQKVRVGNDWKVLDSFVEPGRDFTQGKFGFLIQGNDEIAVSDFKFQPK
jgi:hypothetical protein